MDKIPSLKNANKNDFKLINSTNFAELYIPSIFNKKTIGGSKYLFNEKVIDIIFNMETNEIVGYRINRRLPLNHPDYFGFFETEYLFYMLKIPLLTQIIEGNTNE